MALKMTSMSGVQAAGVGLVVAVLLQSTTITAALSGDDLVGLRAPQVGGSSP
jgi:hypothetical protein